MPKSSRFSVYLIMAVLLLSFILVWLYYPQAIAENSQSSMQRNSLEPTVSKPVWLDKNNNRIADTLDQEINEKTMNDTIEDYVNITILLRSPPTIQDANVFASCRGFLTTSLWTEAVYGFGGIMPYN